MSGRTPYRRHRLRFICSRTVEVLAQPRVEEPGQVPDVVSARHDVHGEQWFVVRHPITELVQPADARIDVTPFRPAWEGTVQRRSPQRHLVRQTSGSARIRTTAGRRPSLVALPVPPPAAHAPAKLETVR
ncbi:hypothetical protein [Pseudonocardia parietis]|uniref:Uncharacterized protein n=1 Tax=Pseudonocardia parietis TaxID=570936 RepID=A0ABS4W1M5_9PSEU|nr:hypothetical protein [Pseudonocardia parietis]MBP2370071.1 hypothetical protein [Pseudonocardia parietis]